jgi:hypothetical protein
LAEIKACSTIAAEPRQGKEGERGGESADIQTPAHSPAPRGHHLVAKVLVGEQHPLREDMLAVVLDVDTVDMASVLP